MALQKFGTLEENLKNKDEAKFVHYGYIEKKLTLYVPWFISDGPLKFEVSN